MIKHIPNIITGLNIFSGCLAVVFALYGLPAHAAMFILLSAIFDFCDGFAARVLNAYSNMGKELDSLADLISFGFAPAAIAYNMLTDIYSVDITGILDFQVKSFILLIPFIIIIASAFRLAKFNIDTRQTVFFLGLPTPANALFWASLPIVKLFNENAVINTISENPIFIIVSLVVFSILLVSEIPMFSFKVKTLGFKENAIRYIYLMALVVSFIIFDLSAVVFVIPIYIVFSLLSAYIFRN